MRAPPGETKIEKFYLGLEKFGVDVDALNMTSAPKRYFHYLIEDWEKPLLKKNEPVARENLIEKYQGLVFCDINYTDKALYTVSSGHMEYKKVRKVSWTVLAEPSDYD